MGSSPIRVAKFASVAQSVEQRTENPRVVGSIPTGGTKEYIVPRFYIAVYSLYADLAHLVERHLAKVEVASSSLVIRSINPIQTPRNRLYLRGIPYTASF